MKKEKSNAVRPRGHALGRLMACFFCLFLGTMMLPLQAQDQNMPRVSLDVNNGRLIQVIEILRGMTRYNFMFNSDELRDVSGITLHLENVSLSEALDKLLKEDGRGFTYTIQGRTVVIRKESQQQLKSILFKGKVVDEKRLPLPGVTVLLAGTSIGTVTDANGKFRLEIPKQNKSELIFSFVGYKTCRKNVTNLKDSVIVLEPDCCELEEVVSYGYYNVDKRKSTSAVTSLKADDILVMGKNSVDQLLEGHVPGMIFMQNSGQVGATPRIKIRGTTTVLGNQSPLWVVDGVILSDPVNIDPQQLNDLDFVNLLGNAISGINPEDIDQIDILKDASATAIYGPRASNGVIVITTKKGKIGKPSIRYSFAGTYRQRPYYTDRNVNVMNSQERIDFSRELIRERSPLNNLTSWVGYEAAYIDYYSGKISYEEFKRRVNEMETANTDWLGILLKNTFSHSHTVNVSGGDANVRYYTSIGYMDERGNIRGEENKRYSLTSNLNMRFNSFSLQFSIRGSAQKRSYTPQAVGVTDYAYNTARSVSPYDENGNLRFYEKENEGAYTTPFNILNEMNNSSDKINTSQLGFTFNLNYEISHSWTAGLTFSYNFSNTKEEIWYGVDSWYVAKLKYKYRDESYFGANAVDKLKSICPTGGELLKDDTENENYSLRAQMTYNTFLDDNNVHNLTANVIGELSSSKYEGFSITRRGFLEDRGMSFDEYVLTDYPMYAEWLQTEQARGIKKHNLTNLLGLIGSLTYSYKNSYILTANMRIDASNKFGDQSNEKFISVQ